MAAPVVQANEKKRFRLGPAVVNINTCKIELAEAIVSICDEALKTKMTDEAAAQEIKAKVSAKYPDGVWQVRRRAGFAARDGTLPRPRRHALTRAARALAPRAQVFLGRNFGSYVTFVEGKYLYFYIGQVGFVVYQS